MTVEALLKKGQQAAWRITLIVAAVSVLKITAGLITGSLVLLSDGFHSATDLLSTLTSFLGLKIAGKKKSRQFAYGFYKAEDLATLIVGLFIFWVALSFFKEGYSKLFEVSRLDLPIIAFVIALVAIGVDFFSYRYLKVVADQTKARSLLANALDKRNDIFSSSLVFVSVVLSFWQIPYVEGLVTIVIAVLLLKVAFEAARDGLLSLLDVAPEEELQIAISQEVLKVDGVEDCLDLKLRRSGPFLIGSLTVGVRKQINVNQSHDLAEKIEDRLKTKFPQLESVVVHVEPHKSDFLHLCLPVETKNGLDSKLAASFGRSRYFLFVNLKAGQVKGFYFLDNPFAKDKLKAGLKAAKLLTEQKSEAVITPNIGEIAFLALRQNLFDLFESRATTAQKALSAFLNQELKPLQKPTKKEQ